MAFENDTVKLLQAPLERKNVKQRSQSGFTLSYIEGHHAIREANRIFGPDGWERHTREMNMVQCEEKENRGKMLWYVSYTAKSQVLCQGIVREGVGFGQGIDKDLGKAHESAVKEAETDAMKRALMTFGDPFGLALYDKDQANVVSESQQAKTEREGYQLPLNESQTKKAKKQVEDAGGDWEEFVALCEVKNATTASKVKELIDERVES